MKSNVNLVYYLKNDADINKTDRESKEFQDKMKPVLDYLEKIDENPLVS